MGVSTSQFYLENQNTVIISADNTKMSWEENWLNWA